MNHSRRKSDLVPLWAAAIAIGIAVIQAIDLATQVGQAARADVFLPNLIYC